MLLLQWCGSYIGTQWTRRCHQRTSSWLQTRDVHPFCWNSEKMWKNALFRCMASGHLLHSLTLPRSYILKASVLVVQTFSAIFWGWKSEFTNLFALRMYGSDISNLSRLVKKLFRLYPLSKIVGKRILLRRRIRGNPDLSNLSRLVNAQRRGRIGSRTEKSPSISLELRLHPAPPREIGNILKTMSTFPRIILGWVCYWQKYMQKR